MRGFIGMSHPRWIDTSHPHSIGKRNPDQHRSTESAPPGPSALDRGESSTATNRRRRQIKSRREPDRPRRPVPPPALRPAPHPR